MITKIFETYVSIGNLGFSLRKLHCCLGLFPKGNYFKKLFKCSMDFFIHFICQKKIWEKD